MDGFELALRREDPHAARGQRIGTTTQEFFLFSECFG